MRRFESPRVDEDTLKKMVDVMIGAHQDSKRDPESVPCYNQIAWIWATSPDATIRNGTRAIEFATRCCELGHWKEHGHMDTLAAAYAEASDFPKAIYWIEKAITLAEATPATDMPPTTGLVADYRTRLAQYRAGMPFRRAM